MEVRKLWKERISRKKGIGRWSMASVKEWPIETAARFLPAAGQRAESSWPTNLQFLCAAASSKAAAHFLHALESERIVLADYISLNRNTDFRRLYRRGKSFTHPALVTYVMRNRAGICRFGITTSKKIGNAVERNRSKRVIRAAFFAVSEEILGNWDIVFVARSRTKWIKSTELEKVMQKQLCAAGVIPSKEKKDLWKKRFFPWFVFIKKKFRLCFRHAAVFILPAPSMPWRQLSVLAHGRAARWPCGGFCGVIRFFRVDMILCLLKNKWIKCLLKKTNC